MLAHIAGLLPPDALESQVDRAALAQPLWDLIIHPGRAWAQADPSDLLSSWQFTNYAVAMLHAIMLLLPPVSAATGKQRRKWKKGLRPGKQG